MSTSLDSGDRRGSVETLVIGRDGRHPTGRRSGRVRRVGPVVVISLLVALVLGYVAAVDWSADRLPRDTWVGGVALGGLTHAEAEQRLRSELAPRLNRIFQLKIGPELVQLPTTGTGLGVDFARSARVPTHGGPWDPRQIWWVRYGGSSLDPVLRVDEPRLAYAVASLGRDYDTPPVNASLELDGLDGMSISEGQDGLVIDQAEAAAALRAAYLAPVPATITLPVRMTPPAVSFDAAQRADDRYVRPALSGDVTVQVRGGGELRITPRVIARSLTFVARGHELVPRLDGGRLLAGSTGDNQLGVSAADLAAAVEPALTRTGPRDRTVEVRSTPVLHVR